MNYLENYEVKKSNRILILILICFSIIINGIFIYNNAIYKKSYIQSQQRLVGSILRENPKFETEVVSAIVGKVDESTQTFGAAILNEYGYSENLNTKLFYKTINKSSDFWIINIFLLIISLLILFLNYKSHVRIYSKLAKIEKWTRALIEKRTDFRISEVDDGEISKLFMSFNKVNTVISESLENVKKEKKFLINLLSDISHQLKTPLSSMILNNEILISKDLERDKQMKFLNSNEKQLIRMKGLIENLLKLAKLDAGAIKFNNEKKSIKKTVEKALYSLAEIATKQGIIISLRDTREVDYDILHDSFWVEEAIINIVKNCIEHSNDNGIVKVYIKRENIFTRIIIEDNGEGIYKEELPYIFDRFFKSSKSKKKDSAGIGLNLARTIIEEQNGEITVESNKGMGTRFEVSFLN